MSICNGRVCVRVPICKAVVFVALFRVDVLFNVEYVWGWWAGLLVIVGEQVMPVTPVAPALLQTKTQFTLQKKYSQNMRQ